MTPSTPEDGPIEATLILLDLVNYSQQAAKAGDARTKTFNRHIEKQVRDRGVKHGLTYIKRIGDAHLLYSREYSTLAAFIRDFFNESRIESTADFHVAFRMLADRDAYSFCTDDAGAFTDVDGSSQILLFRLEKLAQRDRAVVTPRVFKLIRHQLEPHGILESSMELSEAPKGTEGDAPRQLHILAPPLPAALQDASLPKPFLATREYLRAAVQFIPVFGDLYPAIPMAEDFLNLSLERHHTQGAGGYYRWEMPDFERRMGLLGREEKDRLLARGEAPPNLDRIGARDLFKYVRKGVIAGLPGAGKTTILRHFAYRALDADAQAVVAFAEAKHLLAAHLELLPKEDRLRPAGILHIVAALILLPGGDPQKFTTAQTAAIKATAEALLAAWEKGRAIILLDALDEAAGHDQRVWLSCAANELMRELPLAATPEEALKLPTRACFLTLRVAELGSYQIVHGPLFLVNSLDMEQIRRIAARRYGEDSPIYAQFDQLLPYRTDIQRIAGTPLTAMLMVFYFEVHGRFDTRHATYRLLVLFILAKAWERIKGGLLSQSGGGMASFWEAVKQPDYFQREPEVALQYRALGHAAACILYERDRAHKDAAERSVSQQELAELLVEGGIPAGETSRWIAAWRRENFLLPAGADRLVPLHSTLFEFLAGEHLVEHLNDSAHPSCDAIAAAFADRERDHLEVLPIACSASPEIARRLMARLEQTAKSDPQRFTRESTLPLRCVIGSESIEAARLNPLTIPRIRTKREVEYDQPQGKSWAYKHLAGWFDKPAATEELAEIAWLNARLEEIKGGLKLERGIILKTYLAAWRNTGLPLEVKQGELLKTLLDPEVARKFANRLEMIVKFRRTAVGDVAATLLAQFHAELKKRHSPKFVEAVQQEWLRLPAHLRSAPDDGEFTSVLGLDVPGHPWDNNLAYYRVALPEEGRRLFPEDKVEAGELVGFLGSPNLRTSGTVKASSISEDGSMAVTANDAGVVLIWDVATGRELRRFTSKKGVIQCCAIAREGRMLVTGGYGDRVVWVWDAASGKLLRTLEDHQGMVLSCAVTPDGARIVSGSDDQTVRVWDATSGKLLRTLEGHKGWVLSCAVTPNGARIISGSQDKTVRVWDATSGKLLRTLEGHQGMVRSCAVSPDGARIVSGSSDQTVRVWDAASGKLLRTLEGHQGRVLSCAVSPDGARFVSGSDDQTVRVWDSASGKLLRTLEGHQGWVWSCAMTPDGARIVSGSEDQTVRVWDTASGKLLRMLEGHQGLVLSCAVSPDGARFVSGSNDQTVRVWDAASGKLLRTLEGHQGRVLSCAVSPDGARFVSGSEDQTVRVWDAASGKLLRTLEGHKSSVWSCAVTPDGARIVSGSDDHTVRVWDAASGKLLRTLEGQKGRVLSCAVMPDGARIVSGSNDHTVRVWDAASGKLLRTLEGHRGWVLNCAVTPDGARIVSGSDDHTMQVWDAASGNLLLPLEGHQGMVWSCAVTPDGARIVSGSDDQTVRVWSIATGRLEKTYFTGSSVHGVSINPTKPNQLILALSNGTCMILNIT